MQDHDSLLEAARHLRLAARLIGDRHPTTVKSLHAISDRLQNEACGFSEPAQPYDTPPQNKQEKEPLPWEC